MANVNSLEAMQNHQRIQQLRPQNPQAYGHMNGNQGVLMLNGQAMMANVPSQGMAMGLSQAAMGGIPMNFTPNGAAVASPYPPGPMSAGVNPPITLQSPTPTTPSSSGGNKKRKATPQLTAKAKNNLVGSPLNAESSIGSGPMSPATKPSPHSHDPMAPQPSLPPATPNSGALLSNNNIQPGNGTPLVGTPASHSGNNQTSHPPPAATLATSSGAATGTGNVSASTSLSGTGVQPLSSTVDLGHDFDSIPPLDMNSLDSLSMPMDDYASAFMDNPIPGFDLENFDMKQFMEHQP
ncbi:hypothetical protein IWQ60_012344 [Tieghemiomyces parasiticus]|uniref:Uncharacterized protein n=1 Tax=Tieghemiomyces parasiticus TaxID=78921 RepID=A0A9W7ZFG0_9FUNG|nr:hypothetical protein IWQ60_012344 [Tieghemiomyces parasiticus]